MQELCKEQAFETFVLASVLYAACGRGSIAATDVLAHNPSGEFGRFLILGTLAIAVLLLAVDLIIVATDIRTAGRIALSVTTAAGGRVVYLSPDPPTELRVISRG